MPYRIAGIDVHKKRCWPWLWPTSKARASTSLRGASSAPFPTICDYVSEWFVAREVEEVRKVEASTHGENDPQFRSLDYRVEPLTVQINPASGSGAGRG